jgi:hypothetical protein
MYYNNGLSPNISQKMSWIPNQISINQYWQTSLTSVTLGGMDLTSTALSSAIIDSGTSAVVFNQDLYNAVVQNFFSTP